MRPEDLLFGGTRLIISGIQDQGTDGIMLGTLHVRHLLLGFGPVLIVLTDPWVVLDGL